MCFALRAPRQGSVGVDLRQLEAQVTADAERGRAATDDDAAEPTAPREALPWPSDAAAWQARVLGSSMVAPAESGAPKHAQRPFVAQPVEGGALLVTRRLFEQQRSIAAQIRTRLATQPEPPPPASVESAILALVPNEKPAQDASPEAVERQRIATLETRAAVRLAATRSLSIVTGGPGTADAKDPIDRESSAVQAVACFCPPTDFMNWSGPGDEQLGIGEIGTRFKGAWDARIATREGREQLSREVSPIYFVSARMVPTLVLHGDADKLVFPYQARIFEEKCKSVNAPYKLVMREGKDHNWSEMATDRAQFVALHQSLAQ
jgi:hypothetical protein